MLERCEQEFEGLDLPWREHVPDHVRERDLEKRESARARARRGAWAGVARASGAAGRGVCDVEC